MRKEEAMCRKSGARKIENSMFSVVVVQVAYLLNRMADWVSLMCCEESIESNGSIVSEHGIFG
jgi:hypothetical protein